MNLPLLVLDSLLRGIAKRPGLKLPKHFAVENAKLWSLKNRTRNVKSGDLRLSC
jgi:hypothetical protein